MFFGGLRSVFPKSWNYKCSDISGFANYVSIRSLVVERSRGLLIIHSTSIRRKKSRAIPTQTEFLCRGRNPPAQRLSRNTSKLTSALIHEAGIAKSVLNLVNMFLSTGTPENLSNVNRSQVKKMIIMVCVSESDSKVASARNLWIIYLIKLLDRFSEGSSYTPWHCQ